MRRAAVLLLVAFLAGCGGSTDKRRQREEALRTSIGQLAKGRITCDATTCSVIAPTPLHSNYEGFLLAVPVFEQLVQNPDLADVKRVTLTLNDDASGQVFSITCAAGDLAEPMTPMSLNTKCHSISL
jgi:hypothetical protein